MTTKVNEHFNASIREFHQNTSADTLQYAISFPIIVEEMLRCACKQSFVFFTSPSSYYEVPDKFISFDTLPEIPYRPFKYLSTEDLELIIDYKKRWLQACKVTTVRSHTTKDKFSTLPVSLYECDAPDNKDTNFRKFFSEDTVNQEQEKQIVMSSRTFVLVNRSYTFWKTSSWVIFKSKYLFSSKMKSTHF